MGRQDLGGPHVGPMNLAIWGANICNMNKYHKSYGPLHNTWWETWILGPAVNELAIYAKDNMCIMMFSKMLTFQEFLNFRPCKYFQMTPATTIMLFLWCWNRTILGEIGQYNIWGRPGRLALPDYQGGGGGGFYDYMSNMIIIVYIYFKYDFLLQFVYLNPPIQYCNKKIHIWNNLGGGAHARHDISLSPTRWNNAG